MREHEQFYDNSILVVGNLAKDVINNEEQFGGCAANLALGAKKMGMNVGIMSVLGKDQFSKTYRNFLIDNGIDVSLIEDSLEELPVCEVISNQNSISSSVWHDNGCHPSMDLMEVQTSEVNKYGLAHLVSCPPTLARNVALTNVRLSFEPGPMLIRNPEYYNSEVAGSSTLIFMNEEEFAAEKIYFSENFLDQDQYHKLFALVVTLGKDGVKLFKRSNGKLVELDIPAAHSHSDIIDPTGAGDNFKAGFLSGYMRGYEVEKCIQIGAEMGAACVIQKGGILPGEIVNGIKEKYGL